MTTSEKLTPQPVNKTISLAESIDQIVECLNCGQFQKAASDCQQLLVERPAHAKITHLLGRAQAALQNPDAALATLAIAHQLRPNDLEIMFDLALVAQSSGRYKLAVEWLQRAIDVNKNIAEFYCQLGLALLADQQVDASVISLRQALRLKPNLFDAYNHLGVALRKQGKLDESVAAFSAALRLQPRQPETHNSLALALFSAGRIEEALLSCRQAVLLQPDYAEGYNTLGLILMANNRADEAKESFVLANKLAPTHPGIQRNLLSTLAGSQQIEEAISQLKLRLIGQPSEADWYNDLGMVLLGQGRLQEAADCFVNAISLAPQKEAGHNGLGLVLSEQGKFDDALLTFQEGLKFEEDSRSLWPNLLFSVNYHPFKSAEEIYAFYQQWNARVVKVCSQTVPVFSMSKEVGRRLRIGYVSPDFRQHSVAYFAEPLLSRHDKHQFEVYCYYNSFLHDEVTQRFKEYADHWVPCQSIPDDELVRRIRKDKIDILVDLAGHTAGNRLMVFAQKPAPVQVSWMGYGYTTGLTAIDYFIGDASFTPDGCEHLFSEKIHRLPRSFVTYQPPATAPLPSHSPMLHNDYVTFACLSRTIRINERLLTAWADILRRVPDSRLRLDNKCFADPARQKELYEFFDLHGVAPERLKMGYTTPVWDIYHNADIVLDCFPHNSGTTTCEALWMGVPVVTLADRPSMGRLGASFLTSIGKSEWIASDVGAYVDLAVALAGDEKRLVELRADLRPAMLASALLDYKGFARDMEQSYRTMWQRWCHA